MSVIEKVRASASGRNDSIDAAARVGLLARGLLYLVVGALAARVAMGDQDERADRSGAIDALARQRIGSLLLALLLVGLVGYGLWRLSRGIRRDPDENAGKRFGHLFTFALYAFYTGACLTKLLGDDAPAGGGSNKERDWTAQVLGWRFGSALVIGVGLGCWAFGGWRAYRALAGDFDGYLERRTEQRVRRVIVALARVGHAATGVAFGLIGWFFVQAGRQNDASEAKGLDASLKELADRSYGPLLLLLVAAGLIAFGLWCFAESRFRSEAET